MERISRKLDALKSQLDALQGIIEPIFKDPEYDVSLRLMKAKLESVHVYSRKYDEHYEELIAGVAEGEVKTLTVAHSEFQCASFQLENMIETIIDRLAPEQIPDKGATAGDITTIVKEIVRAQQSSNTQARLPKLDIKPFAGGYTEWMEFSDTFQSSVGSKPNLSPVQKLQYLKSCVKDEPASLLKNITLTDDNYDIAWQKLLTRYDNKKAIREAYFEKIFSAPSLQSKSTSGLRKLVNGIDENLKALENLGETVWDSIVIFIVKRKLDSETRLEWERHVSTVENPTFNSMVMFINDFAGAIESSAEKPRKSRPAPVNSLYSNAFTSCYMCKSPHRLTECAEFQKLSAEERKVKVMAFKLCLNCFSRQHFVSKCPKPPSCNACRSKHHPLLHFNVAESARGSGLKEVVSGVAVGRTRDVLLATAVVNVLCNNNQKLPCRVLLDSGSQCSFISRKFVNRSGLSTMTIKSPLLVKGIGGVDSDRVDKMVRCQLFPIAVKGQCVNINALVLENVTSSCMPKRSVKVNRKQLLDLELADECFTQPANVDMILGADVYPNLLLNGVRTIDNSGERLLAQQTVFGWTIIGSVPSEECDSDYDVSYSLNAITVPSDDNFLRKFWELENIPQSKPWSLEEKSCEKHFVETVARGTDGRYCVSLPFNSGEPIGESRAQAVQRQLSLERRFTRQPELKKQYSEVIHEYFDLGHAEPVPVVDSGKEPPDIYYLPHHCVINESRSTTKVRVVYDASAKSSTGVSLNDRLMVGPCVQQELLRILLRFRIHSVVFTADAAKMYRQVVLDINDRDFHRFVWRDDPAQTLKDYRMTRVTFGVASSAYHATRVFQQLAEDESSRYPRATSVLNRDFYVDDCASGDSDTSRALNLLTDLKTVLKGAGFDLRKVSSNSQVLLQSLPEADREVKGELDSHFDSFLLKTLGVYWYPAADVLTYSVKGLHDIQDIDVITKRFILSETSKIFDPLGLLSPAIMTAKVLFQCLWLQNLDWDDPVPIDIKSKWLQWRRDLQNIEGFQIDRCVSFRSCLDISYQLHGFADASEAGYAAVVYLRCFSRGKTSVKLLASKTKVSPVKRVSLPRLELCAAALLARLVDYVISSIKVLLNCEVYAWLDSSVALDWICGSPQRWKTFVANRVSYIQDIIAPSCWRYCPSEMNPSDCASRGIMPSELLEHSSWWSGPSWLLYSADQWPVQIRNYAKTETLKEMRKGVVQSLSAESCTSVMTDLFPYSSLTKLVRVTAWCLRLINSKRCDRLPTLSRDEINAALNYWIKAVQNEHFHNELVCLKSGKQIPNRSKLSKLSPFIDSDGILRVGGRLEHSELPYSRKYPAVLPKKHPLVNLILDYEHKVNLHAGPQLLLTAIRKRFWILGARNLVRLFVHNCVKCRHSRAKLLEQFMAALPPARVNAAAVFDTTGVDYAGPILLRSGRGRGTRLEKAWIALFVCFATKAIHIELVSGLCSESFIAALKRFVSRRGKPTCIYSDNGSNFVGADRKLKEDFKRILSECEPAIRNQLQNDGIEWRFSPPTGSHFGGLWEAGIKSVRYHLVRIVGTAKLTFEEMATVLCQIEACLNSRPITQMSTDPADLEVLTPGHFLIGRAINCVPELDIMSVSLNRLSRWQHIQKLHQHFWKRWSLEYLSKLAQRPKWCRERRSLIVDDLVIIADKDLPPTKWRMGRVVELHPGTDGRVRVVSVKTQNGLIKRPVTKLSLLLPKDG